MIVQGCAGSGKSMIMLHRLPIILYDNPKSLNRSNLYIITPKNEILNSTTTFGGGIYSRTVKVYSFI